MRRHCPARRCPPASQVGAALLAAMLTVSLVATFAAAALWQQWRGIEVETAERARVQSAWLLTGALDWARLLLREDGKSGDGADYLAEPWAVPLQEARLSTFLAADKTTPAEPGAEAPDAFLSGQIIDLQSRMNVANLIDGGKVSAKGLTSFTRLFELLGLPSAELATLAANLRLAADTSAQGNPLVALVPRRTDQLVWLGLSAQTVAVLRPYVTMLPTPALTTTPVNLNTASAEVIYAMVDGITLADAQRLVTERDRSHFRSPNDARKLLAGHETEFNDALLGVGSGYFEVHARLRLDQLTVEQRSVVYRTPGTSGADVTTLYTERGVAEAAAPAVAKGSR